jgi:hypothetical protein
VVEVSGSAPGDVAGFLGNLEIVGDGSEGEEDVVMEMVGLTFTGGNSVDVEAGERRGGVRGELSTGLFDDFAASGIPDLGIFRFDVAAGQEPTLQAAVVNQKDTLGVGGKDNPGAGNVARSELMAGERVRSAFQQHQDQLAGLGIGNAGRLADECGDWGSEHDRNEKALRFREGFKVNRATSYSPT